MTDGPKVTLLVLCDAVYIEPTTQKLSILGITSNIQSDQYPVTIPRMIAVAHIANPETPTKVEVSIVDAERRLNPLVYGVKKYTKPSVRAGITMIVKIDALDIPAPGFYHLEVVANGDLLDRRTVSCTRATSQGGAG